MSDAEHSIVSGAKWTTFSTLVTNAVGVFRLSILTRLLEKSDFGLMAILSMVLEIVVAFSNLGFATAIMHKQDLTRKEFCSLYWIQFIVFGICYLLIISVAYPVSSFYGEMQLLYLLPLAGLGIIFNSVGNFYGTVFQKNMDFKFLSIRNVIASIVSLTIAVVLALNEFGVYSLVFSDLLNALIFNVWNFIYGQKYIKIRFFVSFKLVKPLVKIGLYQTGTQFLDLLSSRIDIFIISKFLGTETLGMYNIAKSLVLKVVTIINGITNTVALPFFSKIQNDENLLRHNYLKVMNLLSHIDFPICILIGSMSFFIVPVLYGSSYEEIIPVVALLSIWSMLCCVGNPVGNIIQATGQTNQSFKYTVLRMIIVFPCVCVSSYYGIIWVAVFQIISSLLVTFLSWYLELWQTIRLKLMDFIGSFIDKFVVGIVIGGAVYGVGQYSEGLFFPAVYCGLLLLILYGIVYLLFYRDMLFKLKQYLIKRF